MLQSMGFQRVRHNDLTTKTVRGTREGFAGSETLMIRRFSWDHVLERGGVGLLCRVKCSCLGEKDQGCLPDSGGFGVTGL